MDRLTQHGRSSSQLWRSLSTMLGRDRDTFGTTGHTADGFAEFFSRKVDDVRSATAGQPAPTVIDSAPSSLPSFRRCSDTGTAHRHVVSCQVVLVGPCTNVSATRIRRPAATVCHMYGKCIVESEAAA